MQNQHVHEIGATFGDAHRAFDGDPRGVIEEGGDGQHAAAVGAIDDHRSELVAFRGAQGKRLGTRTRGA
ncbi:hypothetical protein ASE14_01750 [Agromyces sp. Root81]|nr:hypothetical protein ASE14_01750 [Agromyces sp. Root81]